MSSALQQAPEPIKVASLLARWMARQLLVIVGIALAVAAGMVLVFDQRVGPTLIYCFCITGCCVIFVQALRLGSARLIHRGHPCPDDGEEHWPGWPLMIGSLLVGTALGYSLGVELGNWLTGFKEAGLHNSSLRRALSILLITLIPGLGMTFYFVGQGRLAAAEMRTQTAQRQAAEHQLRLLESQLEPHMLFNTLANLRVLIALDPPRAQAMLDRLIAFLRATLNASRSASHPLAEEFARLQDYLALMQVRMGERLRTRFELPPELAELAIPPLLLQPLVENAIKHGLEPAVAGGELRIGARREQDRLLLEVQDSGVGLGNGSGNGSGEGTHFGETRNTGFGLHQVRERLATRYGAAAALSLAAVPGSGTLATISLPIP